jgi:putative transposase
LIKAVFSRGIPRGERVTESRVSKGERGTWQRRCWEHLVRDERDYERYVECIHFKPVNHETRKRHPFASDAWVLLPEHMYCTWTLPRASSDFSLR